MDEQRQLASQIRQTCEDEGYTKMYPNVTPLEEQEVTITRSSFREHPSEAVCDNNRCLSDGMAVWDQPHITDKFYTCIYALI